VAPLEGGCRLTQGELDCLPLLAALSRESEPARGAAVFHATLARGLADWTIAAARRGSLKRVALGGGCLLNMVLGRALEEQLTAAGLTVYRAQRAPANDGGLSLGQAWAALGMAVDRAPAP
ncbi:MAG: carbamoyltransferase HypF, partial [Candidatus Competibacteraceae bacterium]|nr:carbamoyltransferase HypF [Candidatus Competibacteraceae bacterium]